MRALLCLLLCGLSAFAEIKVITVSGVLDHGENTEIFGAETLPFSFSLRYDDEAFDWLVSPALGIYYSDDQPVTFTVGDRSFVTIGSEVRVYSGEGGLWGFTFGNRRSYDQHGLTLPDYFGTYGSFIQPFKPAVAPTDGLRWLAENASDPANSIASYAYISGATAAGDAFRFQQSGHLTLTVAPVPEPSVSLLCAAAVLVVACRRKRRSK